MASSPASSHQAQYNPEITVLCCRGCLVECSEKDLDASSIALLYEATTGYRVERSDIPKKLCTNCFQRISHAFSLLQDATLSEAKICKNLLNFQSIPRQPFTVDTILKAAAELEGAITHKLDAVKDKREIEDLQKDDRLGESSKRFKKSETPNSTFRPMDASTPVKEEENIFCEPDIDSAELTRKTATQRISNSTNSDTSRLKCILCDKEFRNRRQLTSHTSRVHPRGPLLICSTCGMNFKTNQALRQHERIHTGKYIAKCPICEKCMRPDSIRRHLNRIHSQ